MTPNNNFSVLPWYNNIDLQNHRKSYAYGNIYPLFTPAGYLLPFQIIRRTRVDIITNVTLYDKDDKIVHVMTQDIKEAGLTIVKLPALGYDVIFYAGNMPMAFNMADGIYYASISDGVETWYSEMFTVVQSVSGYLKIEWYDVSNLIFDSGVVVYKNPLFKNRMYICADIGKPDYTFKEEGEDRDGYFFPEKQLSEKTFRFIFLGPEFICDVMRLIRMADYVTVTDKYGRVYHCDTFLITPKWQTQGDLASIEVEFETDTVVKKIGRAYLPTTNIGDFNTDFNPDFKMGVSLEDNTVLVVHNGGVVNVTFTKATASPLLLTITFGDGENSFTDYYNIEQNTLTKSLLGHGDYITDAFLTPNYDTKYLYILNYM